MRRIHCDFSFDWAQETGDFEFKERDIYEYDPEEHELEQLTNRVDIHYKYMNKLFPDSDINVEFNGPHMTDVEFQVESDERDKMELYITLVLYIGRIVRGEDADLAGRMASAVSRIANAGIEPDDEDPPDYLH